MTVARIVEERLASGSEWRPIEPGSDVEQVEGDGAEDGLQVGLGRCCGSAAACRRVQGVGPLVWWRGEGASLAEDLADGALLPLISTRAANALLSPAARPSRGQCYHTGG